jgi:GT2 family glycosyltransferase
VKSKAGCQLTVIVPTYNRCELLGRALREMLEQTVSAESYEIVVVDDGSTDDTPAVVEGVRAPEERLRYFRQENKGPAAARNLGVREARGEIVLFTGDDCLPDRRLLEEHLKAHERTGDVGVVGHVSWHPELKITPFMAFLEEGAQFGFKQIADAEDVAPWHFYTANCSVRKHWLEEVGGFDEDFKHAAYEDVEVAYRMQKRGLRIVYRVAARTYHHHETTLDRYLVRQRLSGRAAALFYRKHPELKVDLGIAHSARMTTALKFFEAASEYAYALGVRDELRGEEPPPQAELGAFWQDAEQAEAGRRWVREVFGEMDPDKDELLKLRAELQRTKQEWERVTSRRLYRWAEGLARAVWSVLRRLGLGRGARVE